MSAKQIRISSVSVILALYAAACATPTVYFDEGGHACTAIHLGTPPGIMALMFGWVPPYTVPWSANIALLGGVAKLVQGRSRWALRYGVAASLLGLTTLVPAAVTHGQFMRPQIGYV